LSASSKIKIENLALVLANLWFVVVIKNFIISGFHFPAKDKSIVAKSLRLIDIPANRQEYSVILANYEKPVSQSIVNGVAVWLPDIKRLPEYSAQSKSRGAVLFGG